MKGHRGEEEEEQQPQPASKIRTHLSIGTQGMSEDDICKALIKQCQETLKRSNEELEVALVAQQNAPSSALL